MDREQEITLFWMKANRRILEGETLKDCEKDIKEIEEWMAAGKSGLPQRFYSKLDLVTKDYLTK